MSRDHTLTGNDAVVAGYGLLGYQQQLYGTDDLGNQRYIMTSPTGALKVVDLAFWKVTGSYYNELYYFSGLVAFDTYAAKASMRSRQSFSYDSPEAFTHISESSTTWTFGVVPYIVHQTTAAGHIKGTGPVRIKNGVRLNDVISRRGPFFVKAMNNGWMVGAGNFSLGVTDRMFTTSFRSVSNGYAGWDSQYVSVTNQYQLNWKQLGYIAAVAAFPALLESRLLFYSCVALTSIVI